MTAVPADRPAKGSDLVVSACVVEAARVDAAPVASAAVYDAAELVAVPDEARAARHQHERNQKHR